MIPRIVDSCIIKGHLIGFACTAAQKQRIVAWRAGMRERVDCPFSFFLRKRDQTDRMDDGSKKTIGCRINRNRRVIKKRHER